MTAKKAYGDWQTPEDFAYACCHLLKQKFKVAPDYVIEPTCGVGNFLAAAHEVFPYACAVGMEINSEYVEYAQKRFSGEKHIRVVQGDFLHEDIAAAISPTSSVLVVGNPPWATNTMLTKLESANIPEKSNFKQLRGIDAITGASNFDICEYIILKSIDLIHASTGVLAMLCKRSTARNVCIELIKRNTCAECTLVNFDSKQVFGVDVAACLLVCDFRAQNTLIKQCDFSNIDAQTVLTYDGNTLRAELPKHLQVLLGDSQLEWRQGVKHDCSKVMELEYKNNGVCNKLDETVCIEDEYLYPYLKSSMLRSYIIDGSTHFIPMTQQYVGEDTSKLKKLAPKLWAYVCDHADLLDGRKSIIYKKAPRFALFGVGKYSFAPYKVAVSGFYKTPLFSLIRGNKPIMLDDTCYFLSFEKEIHACVCMLLLNSELVQEFYTALSFQDNKRPFTKKVLSRLDVARALKAVGVAALNETAQRIGVDFRVSESECQEFLTGLQDSSMTNEELSA